MPNILMFTLCASSPWLGRGGRDFAFENLHASFFITANDHVALAVSVERLGIQLADRAGFRIEVFIGAVEPVRTLVGFEIDLMENTPDARAADRIGVKGVETHRDDFI